MNLDTFSSCHESEHVISEHRIAASCHPVVYSADILRVDYKDVVIAFIRLDSGLYLIVLNRCFSLLVGDFIHEGLDISNIECALANSRVEGIQCLELIFLEQCCHCLIIHLHLPVLQPSAENLLTL